VPPLFALFSNRALDITIITYIWMVKSSPYLFFNHMYCMPHSMPGDIFLWVVNADELHMILDQAEEKVLGFLEALVHLSLTLILVLH